MLTLKAPSTRPTMNVSNRRPTWLIISLSNVKHWSNIGQSGQPGRAG